MSYSIPGTLVDLDSSSSQIPTIIAEEMQISSFINPNGNTPTYVESVQPPSQTFAGDSAFSLTFGSGPSFPLPIDAGIRLRGQSPPSQFPGMIFRSGRMPALPLPGASTYNLDITLGSMQTITIAQMNTQIAAKLPIITSDTTITAFTVSADTSDATAWTMTVTGSTSHSLPARVGFTYVGPFHLVPQIATWNTLSSVLAVPTSTPGTVTWASSGGITSTLTAWVLDQMSDEGMVATALCQGLGAQLSSGISTQVASLLGFQKNADGSGPNLPQQIVVSLRGCGIGGSSFLAWPAIGCFGKLSDYLPMASPSSSGSGCAAAITMLVGLAAGGSIAASLALSLFSKR